MRPRLRPRGLRARLVVAFVLVTVLGAAAVAWSTTRSASGALVDTTQQRITQTIVGRIAAVAPRLPFPPDQAALDRLRRAVGPDTLVVYRGRSSVAGDVAARFPGPLRRAVRDGDRVVTQRIVAADRPWLLVGAPVALVSPDGQRTPSGIQVYAARDLSGVERQIDHLTRSAVLTAALALPLAVLLALLAASSVLRPVRDLRDTADRLAGGDLGARSPPQGADELAQLTATINEMAASLQASMAAMQRMQADARRFAADVSHELRTPLTTLTAVADVLAGTAADMEPDARESAQLAISETHRLVALVEDLMEVSRFDAGTAELRAEDVDASAAVRDCLRARAWLDEVELDAPDGLLVRVDRRRLDVVVANLVANALRHGAPPVRVQVRASASAVCVTVADHGPGLAEDVLPHVFDRFFKADAARARTTGSGLGLAIALENAHLHGGTLTAANADGGGATFVLRLPRDRSDA
jgi:two-component system sensor histidine kinase MtrB